MTATNAAYGDRTNMIKQAVGLFATHMQRSGIMNLLAGKMPAGEAGAEATLRKQTDSHMPIVRVQDLGKKTGDELTFNLLNPVGAYPIMGSNYAEGRGTGLSLSEAKEIIDLYDSPRDTGVQLRKFLTVLAEHRCQLEEQLADLEANLDEVREHEEEARSLLSKVELNR